MAQKRGVLFVPYKDTLGLLGVKEAFEVCENVYRMHANESVVLASPPSFKLDVAEDFNNHWHVKGAFLKETPTTGIRLYNYYDDGARNTVGALDCARYIVLADPKTGEPVAIVDEHWSYVLRSAASAVLACKWVGPRDPKILGLVGIGSMGTAALRCLTHLYKFDEIRCTSRRPETRQAFAAKWSEALGTRVVTKDTIEEVVRGADVIVGGTTSGDIVSREPWVNPGATFISLARRELDPAGWAKMDKVVVDSWQFNMLQKDFKNTVETGLFSREQLHAEIQELVAGRKKGRERAEERILVHTTGLVSQDVALAHFLYERALEQGLGMWLPAATD
ncbi:MAG TPA: ornithine cyclodeaminase family protein [Burkholderiales bacterium]|nr:ornithine cyclodeaminase family protein [Burkholderiales bacterium]